MEEYLNETKDNVSAAVWLKWQRVHTFKEIEPWTSGWNKICKQQEFPVAVNKIDTFKFLLAIASMNIKKSSWW